MITIKNLMIFIIFISLLGCKGDFIKNGIYLDKANNNIYKINGDSLIMTKIEGYKIFNFQIKDNSKYIKFKNDSTELSYDYDYISDTLILSNKRYFSDKIELLKLDEFESINFFNNHFWIYFENGNEYLLKVNNKFSNTVYLYKKIQKSNIGEYYHDNEFFPVERFRIEHFSISDVKFVNLDSRFFGYNSFIITNLNNTSFNLYNLNSNKDIVFKKYEEPFIIPFDNKIMR